MPIPLPLPSNVVVLHPEVPPLTRREQARFELLELFLELDEESQRVMLNLLSQNQAVIRRHTPTAALLRGERGPVRWRRGEGERVLTAPASRRWMYQQAHG